MAEANTKIAAALAAVNAYLQEEEQSAQGAGPVFLKKPPQEVSIWGISGRQDMMSMRQLIQMKAFSRF